MSSNNKEVMMTKFVDPPIQLENLLVYNNNLASKYIVLGT